MRVIRPVECQRSCTRPLANEDRGIIMVWGLRATTRRLDTLERRKCWEIALCKNQEVEPTFTAPFCGVSSSLWNAFLSQLMSDGFIRTTGACRPLASTWIVGG
jgi:hypothetical protein